MSASSESWEAFLACANNIDNLFYDKIKDIFSEWWENIDPEISVGLEETPDIANRLRTIQEGLCISENLRDNLVSVQGEFTGLLSVIQTCIDEAFSPEAYELQQNLTNAEAQIGTAIADLNAQIAQYQAVETDLENERDRMKAQADQAAEFLYFQNPSYIVQWVADKEEFNPGENIVFEFETNIPTDGFAVTIIRLDRDVPEFEEVPTTALEVLSSTKMKATVQVPPDYGHPEFRLRFDFLAERQDICIFIEKFDQTRRTTGKFPAYRIRPCPPPN